MTCLRVLTSDIISSIQNSDFRTTHFCKRNLVPPPQQYTTLIVQLLNKLNTNLTMANVEAETCS
jgi:hypothetical protein